MTTYSVFTVCDGKKNAKIISSALEKMNPDPVGIGTFEIENGSKKWEIGAYFHEKPNTVELSLLELVYKIKFNVSEVPFKDWVTHVRRQLTPVLAGRFIIFGSHDKNKIPLNCHKLKIEAAMAFGTGHHGTTLGCLLALSKLKKLGLIINNAADIGCGTGVLAMATVAAFSARVIACDIDPIAVKTAKINIKENGYYKNIVVLEATGFRHAEMVKRAPFDLIFANILAKPLKSLARNVAENSSANSVVILSGILDRQSSGVEKYFLTNGFSRILKKEIDGWITLVLKRA